MNAPDIVRDELLALLEPLVETLTIDWPEVEDGAQDAPSSSAAPAEPSGLGDDPP